MISKGIADYAPVGNLQVYKELDRYGILGHYHLLLAHQVVNQWKEYQDFYFDRKRRGHVDRVILDNSLIELGHPLTLDEMRIAVGLLYEIDVLEALVLPDVQRNFRETVALSIKAFRELSGSDLAGMPVLGVVQGVTEDECYACARHYVTTCQESLKLLSVPRWMTEFFGTREFILEEVLRCGKPVHLLGFSDNLYDDFKCARIRGVRGIDSAVPIWMGMQKWLLGEQPRLNVVGKRPPWYNEWNKGFAPLTAESIINLMRVNTWLDPIRSTLIRPNEQDSK